MKYYFFLVFTCSLAFTSGHLTQASAKEYFDDGRLYVDREEISTQNPAHSRTGLVLPLGEELPKNEKSSLEHGAQKSHRKFSSRSKRYAPKVSINVPFKHDFNQKESQVHGSGRHPSGRFPNKETRGGGSLTSTAINFPSSGQKTHRANDQTNFGPGRVLSKPQLNPFPFELTKIDTGSPTAFPGNENQAGFIGGFPGTGNSGSFPETRDQVGFPGNGNQRSFPGTGNPPGFRGNRNQADISGGFPSPGDSRIFPGARNPVGFPGNGNKAGFPGNRNQAGFPGNRNQADITGIKNSGFSPALINPAGFPGNENPADFSETVNLGGFSVTGNPAGFPGLTNIARFPDPGSSFAGTRNPAVFASTDPAEISGTIAPASLLGTGNPARLSSIGNPVK